MVLDIFPVIRMIRSYLTLFTFGDNNLRPVRFAGRRRRERKGSGSTQRAQIPGPVATGAEKRETGERDLLSDLGGERVVYKL